MRKIIAISSFLFFTACQDPPPMIDACLFSATALESVCTPVNPAKAQYDLKAEQMDKFTCFSNPDNAILKRWIQNHIKK